MYLVQALPMKRLLFIANYFIIFSSIHSQEKLPPFGKPDRRELEMSICAFDKNADAMKLLDFQEKEVIADYGLKIKTERRVKIKIFNQKGFEFASISIPYSRTKGTKVTDISAYIHYIDSPGEIITTKVSKDQIFRDKEDEKTNNTKFTFPNVRPGCVIEYRYEKTEKNSLHLEPWFFQDFIPTLYSHFTLIIPSVINMDHRIVGVDSIQQKNTYKRSYTRSPGAFEKIYSLNNIPAFRPEPLMSSVADNLKRVEFAIQPSGFGFFNVFTRKNRWEIFATVLNEVPQFGKQFTKPIPGTEKILDSAKKITEREDKINYIFQEVKNQVKWDDEQTFYAGDISEAWAQRTGNSAEINMIVLNLLRKAGISCSPILVSTRNNGQLDEDFFTLSQFNGMDVLLLDSTANYILDGTRKYQSYKTPPENILNRKVFNVDTARTGWLYISDTRPLLRSFLNIDAKLSPEGNLRGNAIIQFYDYSKVQRMADKDKTEEEEEKEEEKEFLKKDFTELLIDSLVQENAENDLEPLKEKFNFSYQPSVTDKFLFLDPFFLSNFRKNPFTDSIRYSSIDFNSRQYLKTSMYITIPDNYEVDHLPKNIRLRMADSSILFERRFYIEKNKILFLNTMEVLYPLFEKEEYPGVRDFFSQLYSMVADQIVLRRKEE